MPLMGGRELADRFQEEHKSTRILYTSGYADATAADRGGLARDSDFIAKPFRPELLANRVRDVLDTW